MAAPVGRRQRRAAAALDSRIAPGRCFPAVAAIDFAAALPRLLASGRLSGDEAALRRAADTIAAADYGAVAIRDQTQAAFWLAWAGEQGWRPVRIALGRQGRSRGFPELANDFQAMRDWCRKTCVRGWAMEALTASLDDPNDPAVTFWFEAGDEAMRFMLKWMPMRCT